MAKNKSSGTKPRPTSASPGKSDKKSSEPSPASGHHLPSPAAIREMIESVAIAFILAFLFRTFEAEAFVIPTGSMAPTLMGRHKDVICPKCGYQYQVSASDEVTADGALKDERYFKVASGTCPMCRFTQPLDSPESYNGDRILVSKLAYEIGEPQRWDVIVFKYPGDPPETRPEIRTDSRINFIKRLVGLPGDTVRIQNGNVWIKSARIRKNLAIRLSLSSPASRRESCWRCFSRCSTTTICRGLPKTAGRHWLVCGHRGRCRRLAQR